MRFAVISDTHFFAPGRGHDSVWWNRALHTRTGEIGECLVKTIAALTPDFVIHCGDITGRCDMENWHSGMVVMDRLPCPWYGVIGNHDTWYPGVREAFSAHFGLPRDRCFHAKILGGVCFVFLDCCYWQADDGTFSAWLDKELFDSGRIEGMSIPPEELQWLESLLEEVRDLPVCLVSHAPLGFKPLYPARTLPKGESAVPEGTPLLAFNRACGRTGDIVNRADVRHLLKKFDSVKLAVSGHVHINDLHTEDGIAFIQTGAMREWPFEFRMIDVKDGIASVTTHGLNNSAFKDESFVKEWGNSWIAGEAAEREFSVALCS